VSGDLEKLSQPLATIKDSQIAKLESDLQTERETRKLERFAWVLGCLTLLDTLAFQHMGFVPCTFVFVLTIVLMVVLGRICGCSDIHIILQGAIDGVASLIKKNDDSKQG